MTKSLFRITTLLLVAILAIGAPAALAAEFTYEIQLWPSTAAESQGSNSSSGQSTSTNSSWSTDDILDAELLNLTTYDFSKDYKGSVTREMFCALVVKMTERLLGEEMETVQASPFDDTYNSYILKAYTCGIVNGTGPATFNPYGLLTRQEEAVMLSRALAYIQNKCGVSMGSGSGLSGFRDSGDIADWATEHVARIKAAGIMQGNDNGDFLPLKELTSEECVVTILRTYRMIRPDTISLCGISLEVSPSDIEAVLGRPSDTYNVDDDSYWSVYKSGDYRDFYMVKYTRGYSTVIYSVGQDWDDVIDSKVTLSSGSQTALRLLTDSNDSNLEYAALLYEESFYDTLSDNDIEYLVFEITNAFRAIHNKDPYAWSDSIAQIARAHSLDMGRNNYFDHTNLENQQPGDRLNASGYSWTSYGENIQAGHTSAISIIDGWINSSGHRQNILGDCKELGVGYAYVGSSSYGGYCTQLFATGTR